jgi:hypothetical protein
MPVDWSRYPENWPAIRQRIRERDGNRCKWCGVKNGAIGYRRKVDGRFVEWEYDGELPEDGSRCKIILTVAHLGAPHEDGIPGDKHDKMDVRDCNLVSLCQKCHLGYDMDEHKHNAAVTRRNKKIAAGQQELFEL